ncbi:MAG: sterol desaturase [Phormidesmis sp.]
MIYVLEVLKAVWVVGWLLLAGDFMSTFIYHVPEHAFGRLHCRVHHEKKQTFQHYAVLSKQPLVMLDGLLGALPYILLAVMLWSFSPVGTGIGLLLGEFHVVWRHTTKMGWQTPQWVKFLCGAIKAVTPEEHWVHHQNGAIAFGDIFTFFDRPAQWWLRCLVQLKKWLRRQS